MKKPILTAVSAILASAAFATTATIREGSVSATQNASHRMIVNYTLDDGPAIVTFDVLTNGVSIGEENLTAFTGDVNKKVESGTHTFHWLPVKSWPGHVFPQGGDVTVSVKVIAWDVDCAPDVIVIDLLTKSNVTYFASLKGLPGGVQDDMYKTDKLVLRKIPAEYVTWKMGSPTTESGYNQWIDIQHTVTLTHDCYMGVYEVTQKQWFNVSGTKPSYFTNETYWATRPVENVAYRWDNATKDIRGNYSATTGWPNGEDPHAVSATSFFGKLRKHSGLDLLDLPTDAQWEYACRAGSGGIYPVEGLAYGAANAARFARYVAEGCVDGSSTLPNQNCTTVNGTATVGSYEPNAWGLYDMLGNVCEWCLDIYKSNPGTSPVTDPVGSLTENSSLRSCRGGGWKTKLPAIRCGSRAKYLYSDSIQYDGSYKYWDTYDFIGFRVCLHLQ